MKLVTSTGDFSWYVDSIPDKVRAFEGLPFKYLNLELTGNEFLTKTEAEWQRMTEELGEAAAQTGKRYVVAHAPCLHNPVIDDEETYRRNIRIIRRSIEACHQLDIKRVVVHACASPDFSVEEFYAYNTKFYNDLLDLAERYNILIMTENWDGNQYHFSTGRELRAFLDHMNHPLLAACWDTAHGNIDRVAREIGQYDNIVALGDKLKGLHISDNLGITHRHNFPFAGIINFDSVLQALLDVNYDGCFTFEASYTLLHQNNAPRRRSEWEHEGELVTKLLNPPIELKRKATVLLYDIGKYLLETYNCFEE